MPVDVKLKDVTAANWEAVAALELGEGQENFVAGNLYSLAESKFDPGARPRAIYAGKRVVGFLMYEAPEAGGRPHEALIYRFMIDRRHQGKGYGRAALMRVLGEIATMSGIRTVATCYMPDNVAVKALYESLGFVEVERDEDGEILARLALTGSDALAVQR
jgi:diamine N-acetyltransferase